MWSRRNETSLEDVGEVEEIPLLDKPFPPSSAKDSAARTSVEPVEEDGSLDEGDALYPTEGEKHGPHALRRVGGKISWPAYLIGFVELCERFSYNGTAAVFINFLQRPLPPGSVTGVNPNGTPGALGLGTNAATAITQFNTLWVYVIPLFGAYIADSRLGRFRTVCYSVGIAMAGHILMILCTFPSIITRPPLALTVFIGALLVMGLGTGGFKSNISPLVAEQQRGPARMTVVRDAQGERVILDPAITTARIYMYFYLMINIGAGLGQISMTVAEKYLGFWAAFTLPTILFCLCPFVLWYGHGIYTKSPPEGSVLPSFLRILHHTFSPLLTRSLRQAKAAWRNPQFWERAKPSMYAGHRPRWMAYDDAFVEEVRRGVLACAVFVFYPLYWISFNQMNNNMTSQAATMTTNGVPNDVINNTNPIALMVLIPVFDAYIYPALRRSGYNFTPLKRIFAGFMVVSSAMVWAGILQWYVYTTSPCGYGANDPACGPSPMSVWWQTGAYVLIAISEIFASITGLEYAFTKAPTSMKSVVMALFLSTSAFASVIGEVLNPLAGDPLLIWNYVVCATLSFVAGIIFWISFRKLDADEDQLNEIGHQGHNSEEVAEEEAEDSDV
ncbi:PTR2-domain-containing protein [Calocera viscosa TUFC12733]|uniref:PTR2-domain-containing protein n=1 Tax=Calocera viscosa (strain TUFC12733) TaxID=1330018 RepID=A0A167N1A1_CALVF|nr:PTR2-domain-containing protein [Calocera viscosa TUFC12733]